MLVLFIWNRRHAQSDTANGRMRRYADPMKILKTFVLCFVGVWLALVLVGHGNELSRFRKADKAKHAGLEIVSAIEIYRASHKELPPDLNFLKLDDDVFDGWGYTREGTGYELSCDVAGFLEVVFIGVRPE